MTNNSNIFDSSHVTWKYGQEEPFSTITMQIQENPCMVIVLKGSIEITYIV